MPDAYRIAYFAHTLRSDWNNGNAHFLRGLLRAMRAAGHDVTAYEPESEWSIDNLRTEPRGEDSLQQFMEIYSDLDVQTYAPDETIQLWREQLRGMQVVILHEWNPPALAAMLLTLREELGFKLLFHDTHHRASSSPEQIESFGLDRFDGIVTFGEALSNIYRERFSMRRVWTLHEAADTKVFIPLLNPKPKDPAKAEPSYDVVWIGNWGDGERAEELREFLVRPAAALRPARFQAFGVRYPPEGLNALAEAGIQYGGYLPNLEARYIYQRSGLALHVPRQQYSTAMAGIPTIRVFEALACGKPLISAPWQDTEGLFRPGDIRFVSNAAEMTDAIRSLMANFAERMEQGRRGLQTVLARHTCDHRAQELGLILKEVLA